MQGPLGLNGREPLVHQSDGDIDLGGQGLGPRAGPLGRLALTAVHVQRQAHVHLERVPLANEADDGGCRLVTRPNRIQGNSQHSGGIAPSDTDAYRADVERQAHTRAHALLPGPLAHEPLDRGQRIRNATHLGSATLRHVVLAASAAADGR